MKTKYNGSIPDESVDRYIDKLISQTFSLLPLYEESQSASTSQDIFYAKQESVIAKLHGFFSYMIVDSSVPMDILSYSESLKGCEDHGQYRKYILKICNLLSSLKGGG